MNFLQNLGTTEWLIITFVLFMLFGKKKIMEWARGLGESGREMQRVKKEFEGSLTLDEPTSVEQPKKKSPKKKKRV